MKKDTRKTQQSAKRKEPADDFDFDFEDKPKRKTERRNRATFSRDFI